MNVTGLAGFASGLANAPTNIVDAQRMGEERAEARAAATTAYEQGLFKLQRQKAAVPMEDAKLQALETQFQGLNQQYLELARQQVFQSSYQATDAYLEDRDPARFTEFFQQYKDSPILPEEFKNVVRVDKADVSTDEGWAKLVKALRAMGYDQETLDSWAEYADRQTVADRFLLLTRPDGSQDARDVQLFGIMSGYNKSKKLEELDILARQAKIASSGPRGPAETELREYARIMARINADEEVSARDKAFVEAFETRAGGAKAGGTRLGERARESAASTPAFPGNTLLEQINYAHSQGIDPGTDLSPEAEQLRKHIRQLEIREKLSPKQVDSLAKVSTNIAVLGDAFNLSPETQGLFDSPKGVLKSYFTDDNEGHDRRMRYEAFATQALLDFHGKQLTKHEMGLFYRAYGNNRQAMSTVLTGISSLLRRTIAEAEATAGSLSPELQAYYFGEPIGKLKDRLAIVDARSQFYQKVAQGRSSGLTPDAAWRKAAIDLRLPFNKDGTIDIDLESWQQLNPDGTRSNLGRSGSSMFDKLRAESRND